MTHAELVCRAESWLRNSAMVQRIGSPRRARCDVVLTEYVSGNLETPDAIGWFFNGKHSILIECKASRSDFLADKNKWFRGETGSPFGLGMFRYYFVNPGVAGVDDLPVQWGLAVVEGRRVKVLKIAEQQERSRDAEMSLLWSECRKIQIVNRGGKLRNTRQAVRVMNAVEGSCGQSEVRLNN